MTRCGVPGTSPAPSRKGTAETLLMTPVLETANLRVTFGTRVAAVRGVSLTVNRGETHCLVGESGCGKSVTALAVMGLLRAQRATAAPTCCASTTST